MKRKAVTTILTLVECALMIAMATVLSMFKLFTLPQGGSVTIASMVPLVLVSYRHASNGGSARPLRTACCKCCSAFIHPRRRPFSHLPA